MLQALKAGGAAIASGPEIGMDVNHRALVRPLKPLHLSSGLQHAHRFVQQLGARHCRLNKTQRERSLVERDHSQMLESHGYRPRPYQPGWMRSWKIMRCVLWRPHRDRCVYIFILSGKSFLKQLGSTNWPWIRPTSAMRRGFSKVRPDGQLRDCHPQILLGGGRNKQRTQHLCALSRLFQG